MKRASSRLERKSITTTNQTIHSKSSTLFVRYLSYIPTLLISLPFFGVVAYIVTKVQPESIAHGLFPYSYLLVLIPFYLGCFFAASFLFLSSRRGAVISFFIVVAFSLRLQSIKIPLQYVLALLIAFGILEIVITLVLRLISSRKNANLTKKTSTRESHRAS